MRRQCLMQGLVAGILAVVVALVSPARARHAILTIDVPTAGEAYGFTKFVAINDLGQILGYDLATPGSYVLTNPGTVQAQVQPLKGLTVSALTSVSRPSATPLADDTTLGSLRLAYDGFRSGQVAAASGVDANTGTDVDTTGTSLNVADDSGQAGSVSGSDDALAGPANQSQRSVPPTGGDAKQSCAGFANQVGISGGGFESDNNAATAFWQDGEQVFPATSKRELAEQLLALIARRLQA